jgi:hypothetical protein
MNQSIKNMRVIGIILFFIGGVIAISAAAKMPEQGSKYPDTLVVFFIAIGFSIIGNILWHKTERAKILFELELHKNDEHGNPIALLNGTIPAIEKLQEIAVDLRGMELCEKVDEVLDTFIHPFTEKRKTFMDILGQANGAEVLLIVAYAERMMNRVWSASSDGHHQEAMNCLGDSLVNYKRALAKTTTYYK